MSVKVYALSTCPYCKMTRQFLDEKGVEYELVEVDLLSGDEQDGVMAEVNRISGGASFPVVCRADTGGYVVGYDKKRLVELLGL